MGTTLNGVMRNIASGLNDPVIIILLLLLGASLVLIGSIIVECFSERNKLKVNLPKLIDELKIPQANLEEVIQNSGLLKRQKANLIEVLHHSELTASMREALAIQIIEEEKFRFAKIVKISDMIGKLGPIFGLLGTLIPLGPGIVALGSGDTITLSQSLLTAFDTTVMGLIAAAPAMIISAIRKSWYAKYMSMLEALMSCVLDLTAEREIESKKEMN